MNRNNIEKNYTTSNKLATLIIINYFGISILFKKKMFRYMYQINVQMAIYLNETSTLKKEIKFNIDYFLQNKYQFLFCSQESIILYDFFIVIFVINIYKLSQNKYFICKKNVFTYY